MGFFGFVFWMVLLWLVFRMCSRWQRRRWMTVGPGGYGWYDSSEFYPRASRRVVLQPNQSKDQQEYIDALESRISDLEERLDFTERLLANRQQSSA
jgi:hypothetical protein